MIQAITKPSSRQHESLFPPLPQDDDALRRQSVPALLASAGRGNAAPVPSQLVSVREHSSRHVRSLLLRPQIPVAGGAALLSAAS
jgi:hypothetical protein